MRFRPALLIALLALLPAGASAQRNELAVDVGILSGGVSYARRVGDSPLSVGAGVLGAWEPPNSFDRNVWEPLGFTLFGRYRPAPWLHTDVGLAGARYLWADDCSSECTGTFVGVRSSVLVGYRWFFIGPEISVGSVNDGRHGSDFGAMWGVQARVIYAWGR